MGNDELSHRAKRGRLDSLVKSFRQCRETAIIFLIAASQLGNGTLIGIYFVLFLALKLSLGIEHPSVSEGKTISNSLISFERKSNL